MANSLTTRIVKAMGIFTGVQSVSIVCSIVRTKFISVLIGPVGVGLFAIYNSVLEMLSTATQLNIRESAVRDISSASPQRVPFIAGVVRWWSRRLGLLGAVLITLLSPLLSFFSFGDISHWWAFAALSVAMLTLSLANGEQALLQGTARLKRLARASVTGALTGTVLSIPLYYLLGVGSIIPSILIFCVASWAAFAYNCPVKGQRNTRQENITAGKDFIRLGAYLTVSLVVTTLASYVFLSYLTRVANDATTGIFQAGYTLIIRYTGVIFTALSMEYFPRVVKVASRASLASTVVSHQSIIVITMLIPLTILFVAFDRIAIDLLYSSEFMQALPFVTIGICSTIFRGLSYCMAYVIVARGDGRTYIVTETMSAAIGLALNITLYHFYGFVGLGFSYIAWYLIYTVIVYVVYRRYGMRLHPKVWLLTLAAVLAAAASIYIKLLFVK